MVAVTGGVRPTRRDVSWLPRLKVAAGALLLPGIVVALVIAQAPPAFSGWCDGDNWADFNSWSDNYLVSSICDTRGEFVRGIQALTSESYPYQGTGHCSAGAVDGFWGPNTEAGVECMQTRWGLPADGSVGSYTWLAYRSEANYVGYVTVNYIQYKLYETDWGTTEFYYQTATADWYIARQCSSNLEPFHRAGPDLSDCLNP